MIEATQVPPDANTHRTRAWRAPTIASVCAALVLLISPFMLRGWHGSDDPSALKRASELNDLLRKKIASVEQALDAARCVHGGMSGPDLPPDTAGLKDALFNSVVMVLARRSGGFASGSGFFIAPHTIATNYHVVENASEVVVINKLLGKLTPASVRAHTPDTKGRDFAVLELAADAPPGPPLALTTQAEVMQDVVIAGYPGVAGKNDAGLQRLLAGDPKAIPAMSASHASISQLLFSQDPALINVNAQIYHGNSGGALSDACGRVVGLPTFVSVGQDDDRAGYALASSSLMTFLDSVGIKTYSRVDDKCTHGVAPSGGTR